MCRDEFHWCILLIFQIFCNEGPMAEKDSTLSSKNATDNILLRNCTDVFRLNAENLKKLCRKFNIPLQLPKKA